MGAGRLKQKVRRKHSLVGRRIMDFWEEDKEWYPGTVLEFNSPEVRSALSIPNSPLPLLECAPPVMSLALYGYVSVAQVEC